MNTPTIVAMVATHERERLLRDRALPSILSQSRPADAIVVVEDGKTADLATRMKTVASGAQYLFNRRTPGLSGTLNTGLDHLARYHLAAVDVFVAFLDDDDAWLPDHLAAIEARISEGAEVVATPFLRLEANQHALRVDPPAAVSPNLFMECNPGIQGSNLAVRLDILLEAGGFNEALSACTDRDLLIRLCRRPGLIYATTSAPSVVHHACFDRPRLSLPNSPAKHAGLAMFDRVHGPLMTPAMRTRCLERAVRIFDWRPAFAAKEVPSPSALAPSQEAETPPLLVGIIADAQRIMSVSRLLDDLADLIEAEGLSPPDVLILENRPEVASGAPLADMVARKRSRLRIRLIDRGDLRDLDRSGEWQPEGADRCGRLAIADARTALQAFLYHFARERPGCAIWILDDDMRLDPMIATTSGPVCRRLPLDRALRRMRATGAAICIGTYTGAPPLPAVASVRGQIVDLLWNLRRLVSLPQDAPVPVAALHNAALRAGRRDYYYDLSRIETDRLETPFALEPAYSGELCGTALTRLGEMIPRILAGEAPLRPLLAEPTEMEAFTLGDSLHRGGNTFIFDPEALADLPNLSPTIEGRPTRRSDMIWSLMQAQRCGRRVVSVPVPVRHDRADLDAPDVLDLSGIADDVRGFAIFNALKDGGENPDRVETLCLKYEEERLAALRLSFDRIRGLARELLKWSLDEAPAHAPRAALSAQARQLIRMFSADNFAQIEPAVRALGPSQVREFIAGLDARVAAHSKRVRAAKEIPRLLAKARGEAARDAIIAHVDSVAPVRVLGQGAEGVVVTDTRMTWKLFDNWSQDQAAKAVPVLLGLVDVPASGRALVRPLAMTRTPVGWLLAMPFEASAPWTGGQGPGLVNLLADLHGAGLVCRNLHPKNLRVADGVVRLIDYGVDLLPLDDPGAESLEFAHMCRRAWLCWRWWWREDLDQLMREALHKPDLPELAEHEGIIHAVRELLGLRRPSDPTMTRALALCPARVLDYGAGKGKEAARLAGSGAEVLAWDPDPGVAPRLDALRPIGVRRAASAAEAVASGPFDLVICRRVACLLDDAALDAVLCDLRAAIAPEGRALLSLCHPAYAHRVQVAEAEVLSPPCGCGAALWTRRSRATGRVFHEVHRTERLLRRRLARAGLRVVGRHERFCTEFERFETVADLLMLELVPASKPGVAMLFKACAMDAEALEIQVRDMLAAMEDPDAFCETVLALDTRTRGFPREHAVGDLDALRAAAQRLLAAGEIDRIVETPSAPEALRALNRRWFGLNLPSSHSEGGAATGALLAGFEACSAPRVLHADVDMMIGRTDRTRNPLRELTEALDIGPNGLTASFPVACAAPHPWTAEGPEGPWRVESRLGLVDMDRINAILPLPNEDAAGAPRLSWHRALDEAVRQGRGASLRGGDGRAFCVHPPNARKSDTATWDEVRAAVARGRVPRGQHGRIEWTGAPSDWHRPERHERFVFVICGRNVMPERFRRCWDTVLRQDRRDWGAVVIDDASESWIADELGRILAVHAAQVSFIARRRRAGPLANTVHAVRQLCASPEQVIVTLDADDHLIGRGVLDRLAEAYDVGADLTVGSMLRTDKTSVYPVRLDAPRRCRGGNVWQHLRSFRKGLFDGVPDAMLRLDGGYVELAADWAFMLPMVEAAEQPIWIGEPLYLHEPGEFRDPARAAAREAVIARLILGGARGDGSVR